MFIDSEAGFTCKTSNARYFSWIVNGTYFNDLSYAVRDDLSIGQVEVEKYELYTLNITSIAEYNRTVVQCEVSTRDNYITSENATLVLQGNWG